MSIGIALILIGVVVMVAVHMLLGFVLAVIGVALIVGGRG